MKTGFNETQQQQIRRAKQVLKHLWNESGLKQAEILAALGTRGLELKLSTLSTWFSAKDGNTIRPKPEYIEPLVEIFTPGQRPAQRQELIDELRFLLGYDQAPVSPELLRNKVSEQLEESLRQSLSQPAGQLGDHLAAFVELLDQIEPKILEYDKGFPVLRIEAGESRLLRQLLGPERKQHQAYAVEDGYEIPLTKIQSLETMIRIIDELNEGVRLLQSYVDRCLNHPDGFEQMDFYRVEDFVSYGWEISDRLLYNSQICKELPVLRRSLLRLMTVCWGIRYLLENQTRETSEIAFQNLLERKGKSEPADVRCSVAVYMGMLARQCVRSKAPSRLERGYSLYTRAAKLLKDHHEQLNTAQEVYFYKKELANLHFDIANLSLACAEFSPTARQVFKPAIEAAAVGYAQVLDEDHVFYQGLSPQRAQHLRLFHVLSQCWTAPKPERALPLIEAMLPGEVLNESYWTAQIARAMAYSILALRSRGSVAAGYRETGLKALEQAALVSGFAERTRTEIESEYMLGILKSPGASRVLSLIG